MSLPPFPDDYPLPPRPNFHQYEQPRQVRGTWRGMGISSDRRLLAAAIDYGGAAILSFGLMGTAGALVFLLLIAANGIGIASLTGGSSIGKSIVGIRLVHPMRVDRPGTATPVMLKPSPQTLAIRWAWHLPELLPFFIPAYLCFLFSKRRQTGADVATNLIAVSRIPELEPYIFNSKDEAEYMGNAPLVAD